CGCVCVREKQCKREEEGREKERGILRGGAGEGGIHREEDGRGEGKYEARRNERGREEKGERERSRGPITGPPDSWRLPLRLKGPTIRTRQPCVLVLTGLFKIHFLKFSWRKRKWQFKDGAQ
ncbi:hypothetical protein AAFF_G00163740, partial [Aldrovandia affinis]